MCLNCRSKGPYGNYRAAQMKMDRWLSDNTCKALNGKGEPCEKWPFKDSDYCRAHSSEAKK